MKKYTAYKTIQLILFILLAALVIFKIFPSSQIYHQVAVDPTMKLLSMVLWAAIGLSFLFILLDYTFFFGYTKEYREMETAVHSDPISGIANRFSCDILIEKYLDKPLPENLGCMMFDLTNIREINRVYGHLDGNSTIRDFSNILRLSSDDLCFVGRNGGNKFLAIFEDTNVDTMCQFCNRVRHRVESYNLDSSTGPIEYSYGSAFHEGDNIKDITNLISLANSRIGMPYSGPVTEEERF
jgi:diguanylate cyclase (GGDEF) domain